MGMVTEEDPVCMRTNDIYLPSAYCERESEPEVSLVLDLVESCYTCMHLDVCMYWCLCACMYLGVSVRARVHVRFTVLVPV